MIRQVLTLFIAGAWRQASDRGVMPVIEPATGNTLGELPVATRDDVAEAVASAEAGFKIWRAVSAYDRSVIIGRAANVLRERADEIAALTTAEQGKPLAESRMECMFAADVLQFAGEEGRRLYGRIVPPRNPAVRQSVQHFPIGVSAAFTPWNFPLTTPARKIGGALAAGCACILKASEETPGSALAIAKAFQDAGLPDGVLNVLFGDPAAISTQLIQAPGIRKISFTGSIPVGRKLGALAGEHLKKATLELGGHAPVIVFDDVDVEQTARMSVQAKFRNAGQICIAPTRFYVHERVHDAFVDAMGKATAALKVDNGLTSGTEMGPVANPRRLDAMDRLVADAVGRGGKVVTGGERIGNRGYFYTPTVLSEVDDDALAMTEEPFGPLALVCRFSSTDEAIARANALPFGLAGYAFTRSADRVAHLEDAVEVGMLGINHFVVAQAELPFAGVKDSGYGAESGPEGIHEYTVLKTVTQLLAPAP